MQPALAALRGAAATFFDLLLPRACIACGAPPEDAEPLCAACREALGPPPAPLRLADLRVRALFPHAGPARALAHALKYHGRRDVARFLARRMTGGGLLFAEPTPDPAPLLVPIPLHPRRETARGYNQSMLLARAIAAESPALRVAPLLVRRRATRSQTALSREQRAANVAGAFALAPARVRARVPEVASRPVLIVDDVVTTGATLVAAAAVLATLTGHPIGAIAAARADADLPLRSRDRA
jgi:ComF family protein